MEIVDGGAEAGDYRVVDVGAAPAFVTNGRDELEESEGRGGRRTRSHRRGGNVQLKGR